MEANPNPTEPAPEASGLTDKQQAQLEENAAAEAFATRRREEAVAEERKDEPVSILNLAGKGHDALHEAMRRANEANKPKPYTPPAMTERQLSAREEELEAGRRAVAKATEQFANRPQPPKPTVKDGFTTPVHRPNDVVPDPLLRAGHSAAGTRTFGADAP